MQQRTRPVIPGFDPDPSACRRLDGRHPSTEVAGGCTVRMVGRTCSRGELAPRSSTHTGTDADQEAQP